MGVWVLEMGVRVWVFSTCLCGKWAGEGEASGSWLSVCVCGRLVERVVLLLPPSQPRQPTSYVGGMSQGKWKEVDSAGAATPPGNTWSFRDIFLEWVRAKLVDCLDEWCNSGEGGREGGGRGRFECGERDRDREIGGWRSRNICDCGRDIPII